MASPLLLENVWLHQQKYEDAEILFRQTQAGVTNHTGQAKTTDSLAQEIAQVRQDIQKVLSQPTAAVFNVDVDKVDAVGLRLAALEKENRELRRITADLRNDVNLLQAAVQLTTTSTLPQDDLAPVKNDDGDDDDIDLFGSDDEETKAIKEKRLQEYADKKAKKPGPIAKSSVLLDIKPWDDETDMAEMEKRVRTIEQDGLVWGASKLVPVGYGIKKLSILCVVEDDKVSIDDLSERITEENEDLVQSVDVAAFNKI